MSFRLPQEVTPESDPNILPLVRMVLGHLDDVPDAHRPTNSQWAWRQGDRIVTTLWFDELEPDEHGVVGAAGARPRRRSTPQNDRKRAAKVAMLEDARIHGLPVRVIVVRGAGGTDEDDPHTRGTYRKLDPSVWWVVGRDEGRGTITLRRGGRLVDGVWVPPAPPAEALPSSDPVAVARDLQEVDDRGDLGPTERQALRLARIGQGAFREALLTRWGGRCAVTGCGIAAVLRASHCKPWAMSTDAERLDPANGLLLCASLDALFDRGLIAFWPYLAMRWADSITEAELNSITPLRRLRPPLSERELAYVAYHNEHCFQARLPGSAR